MFVKMTWLQNENYGDPFHRDWKNWIKKNEQMEHEMKKEKLLKLGESEWCKDSGAAHNGTANILSFIV